MAASNSEDQALTTLRHGPTVHTAAIELALDLEAKKDVRFERNGTNVRLKTSAGGNPVLTAEEAAGCRHYKADLLAIVDYIESGAVAAPEGGTSEWDAGRNSR